MDLSEMAHQNHFSNLATNLFQFFEEEFLCDTILVTEDKELKAHSILLAAVSPVFRAAFESNAKPGLQYIELSTFDSETVEIALHFIYTGKLLLSPQYTHVDNLYQLFDRLKDLGLEAQRLNGCEIRFQTECEEVKENVTVLKKEPKLTKKSPSTARNTKTKKENSCISAAELQVVPENSLVENFKTQGFPVEHQFAECNSTNLEMVQNTVIDGAISTDNGSDPGRDVDPEDDTEYAAKADYIMSSDVKIKLEDGCLIEDISSLKPRQVKIVYADSSTAQFVSSGLSSGLLEGFSLAEAGDNQTLNENLVNSIAAGILEAGETDLTDGSVKYTGTIQSESEEENIHCIEAEAIEADDELNTFVKVEENGSESKELLGQDFYIVVPTDQVSDSDAGTPLDGSKKRFPCHICGKLLTKKAIKSHSLIHTGERPFKCSVCCKTFTMAANLLRHSRLHTGLKPHLCHLCGKSFIQKVTLQDHLAIHLSEKKFRCATCGKMFLKSKQLTQHNNEVHRIDVPVQQNNKNKDVDLESVGEEKPVLCDFCGKRFVSKFTLKQHSKLHMKDKPFKCSHCDKSFLTKQNLGQHMLNHTGEKPFICKTCGMAYKRKHLLQWHEHIHTGEKPYVCMTCGKGFTYSCSLKVHIRTHTGERPYECTVCGNAYSQSNHLKVHMRRHTGEKPFVCEQCGKAYKNRLDLRLHSTRVHNINITKSRSVATNNNWQ